MFSHTSHDNIYDNDYHLRIEDRKDTALTDRRRINDAFTFVSNQMKTEDESKMSCKILVLSRRVVECHRLGHSASEP